MISDPSGGGQYRTEKLHLKPFKMIRDENLGDDSRLAVESRINFGKKWTVEHHHRVLGVGYIDPRDLKRLMRYSRGAEK